MKPLVFALVATSLCALVSLRAADSDIAPPTATSGVASELQAVIGKIQAKLRAGKHTESDLAEDIKGFDAILEKHHGEKTDEVANVLLMKGVLYIQILEENAKGEEILSELKKEFPGTRSAAAADQIEAGLEKQQAAKKIQATLKVGTPFPSFEAQDLGGKPVSVSALKGQVVLIDFWATWSPSCQGEIPNVLTTYQKYHDKGFAVIGVSIDKDKDTLAQFIKVHEMEWPQCFDGLGWQSPLALKYGVDKIPTTYLLDKDGNIVGRGLRGDDLEKAVGQALGGS